MADKTKCQTQTQTTRLPNDLLFQPLFLFFFFIHLAIAHLTQMKLNGMIISNNNFIVGLAHVFVWFFKRKCIYSQRMAFNPTILTCNVIRVNP